MINNSRFRSLRVQAMIRIVLPLSLIITGLVFIGASTYQRLLESLIIERHRQIASLAAASVSEIIEGYVRLLEVLASKHGLQSQSPEERFEALREASMVSEIFTAGVIVVDENGTVITVSPGNTLPFLSNVSDLQAFQLVRDRLVPSFSNVVTSEDEHQKIVLIAVPLFDDELQFKGAVIGGLDLRTTSIKLIRDLTIGKDGIAFLVDSAGMVLAHPDPDQIGVEDRVRPSIAKVLAGENGGVLNYGLNGKRFVESFAPIESSGWGLVIQESWDSVTEPVELIGMAIITTGLASIILAVVLSWKGFERIAAPILALQKLTEELAKGEKINMIPESGIAEIDALEYAFSRMAQQISAYRAGLHRYVGAITKSQEDERRRIARELHDDTLQGLLAISRRLELYQSSVSNPGRAETLAEIQDIINKTVEGIRRINRDLRPLMLEDLGLIPALQALVQSARQGEGAIPHARFKVHGKEFPLSPEQELTLYRITQEALTNIRKHAHATGVSVDLFFASSSVKLEVSDNGKGFIVPTALTDFAQRDHFGLLGMQERVWAVGGALDIQSSPGQGTRLMVTIPISNPAHRS